MESGYYHVAPEKGRLRQKAKRKMSKEAASYVAGRCLFCQNTQTDKTFVGFYGML